MNKIQNENILNMIAMYSELSEESQVFINGFVQGFSIGNQERGANNEGDNSSEEEKE